MTNGLGHHSLAVLGDIPSWSWPTIFRPWNIPPLIFPLTIGFALRWWLMSCMLIIGAYLLFLEFSKRISIAIVLSLALWLSPFFQWWYIDITLCTVGLGCLCAFGYMRSLRSRGKKRIAFATLSVWALIGFALIFYPPFQVPVAIVLLSVCLACGIGYAIENRAGIKSMVATSISIVACALVILGFFYLQNVQTIREITNTSYPGHRRLNGGGTSILQFLSMPFGLNLSRFGLQGLTSTNQCEISSFLILAPFVALMIFRLRASNFRMQDRIVMYGALFGSGIVFLWYFVGIPHLLAAISLLDLVEPQRDLLGVGLSGFVLLAIYLGSDYKPREDIAQKPPPKAKNGIVSASAVCGVVAVLIYLWGGQQLATAFPLLNLNHIEVFMFSVLAGAAIFFLLQKKIVAGGLALLVLGGITSLSVNPLYQGLSPLTNSPLIAQLQSVEAHSQSAQGNVWVSYGGPNENAPLTASGLHTLNAVQYFPDLSFWNWYDPTQKDVETWNRYANVYFTPGAPGSPRSVTLAAADVIVLSFDPCSATSKHLRVGYLLAASKLNYSCLSAPRTVSFERQMFYAYVVDQRR
jgi:hypothetical protein